MSKYHGDGMDAVFEYRTLVFKIKTSVAQIVLDTIKPQDRKKRAAGAGRRVHSSLFPQRRKKSWEKFAHNPQRHKNQGNTHVPPFSTVLLPFVDYLSIFPTPILLILSVMLLPKAWFVKP